MLIGPVPAVDLPCALAVLCHLQEKLQDKRGVTATKAALLLQLGRADEAQALYRQLLDLNPDDYSVHEGLHRCGHECSVVFGGLLLQKNRTAACRGC